jgi:membrane associated rhomboid family serine protease
MFLPLSPDFEGIEPRTKTPSANLTLIALTAAVSLGVWKTGLGTDLTDLTSLALRRSGSSPFQLLSHAFVHADFWHLFGNAVCLFAFGNALNMRLGNLRYLGLYLALCVAGGLAWLLFGGGPAVIGASGVAMGLAGMFFFLFPRLPMNVLVWAVGLLLAGFALGHTLLFGSTFSVYSLMLVFGLVVAFQLRGLFSSALIGPPPEGYVLRFLGFRSIKLAGCWIMPIFVAFDLWAITLGSPDNVAHSAHIGGAGAGVLLALGLTGYGMVQGTPAQPTLLEWAGLRKRVRPPVTPAMLYPPRVTRRRASARLRRATKRALSFSDWQRERLEQDERERLAGYDRRDERSTQTVSRAHMG